MSLYVFSSSYAVDPCFTFFFKTLVRLGAYHTLDLTISQALNQRSPDFPGVVICNASDSLGTLLQLIKKRRVHRLVVVEGEVRQHDIIVIIN